MAVNPLLVLLLPLVYLVASIVVMIQFSAVLSALGQAGHKIRAFKQLAPIEPIVTALVNYLTRVFGPLHKFTPQPTHVLLMAVVVAIVVNGMLRNQDSNQDRTRTRPRTQEAQR